MRNIARLESFNLMVLSHSLALCALRHFPNYAIFLSISDTGWKVDMSQDFKRVAFLLTPDYALMSLAAAVEPLRAANHLAGRKLYDYRFFSSEGGYMASTSAGGFMTEPLEAIDRPDLLAVVSGGNPMLYEDSRSFQALRYHALHGVALGGISGGPVILAKAGLMQGRRFTLHWAHIDALLKLNPELLIEKAVYVIDRDRYTCAGGVAVLDMMGALIARNHGLQFAREISQWFIHARLRDAQEPQNGNKAQTFANSHPLLQAAIALMESHLADPLSANQLADLAGMSLRQLQRLFLQDTNASMMDFYRNLRLAKASELITQTRLPLVEIADLTGFTSQSSFSRAYQAVHGHPPSKLR